MLNLLAYEDKERYLGYVKAFGGVGSVYGVVAKLIGEVTRGDDKQDWDDLALVHYPSLEHFVAMIKSEEYKALDRTWKVGALRDTGLLCVVEMYVPLPPEQG